jgi:hypothetical protein
VSTDQAAQDRQIPASSSPLNVVDASGDRDGMVARSLEAERRTHSYKIGLDANRPIDPKTGRIEPQVADPDILASTGTGWVRLNFILGPWSGPNDDALYGGRTWTQTYAQIVSGLRDKGLNLYGLIGCEAVAGDLGDRFRSPPSAGDVKDEWLDQYIANASLIVEQFHEDVAVFESFNEPDDWHGRDCAWIDPGWFALMLQRIHATVRANPELQHVKLVSGPLQGLEANRNAAVYYLQDTYRAGKPRFGWGQPGIPFPFDGVGYHLYVKSVFDPNEGQQARAIRTTLRRYLDAMHQVILQEEGKDKPLYVSEVGWNSRVDPSEIERREQFQAQSMGVALDTLVRDPLVELGCWFCTQDFALESGEMFFGLYRMGALIPERRKPAFHTFKAFCEGVLEEKQEQVVCTNQQVINAFYYAAVDLRLGSRWSLLKKAGLDLRKLTTNRYAVYSGPPIAQLPNLKDSERALVQRYFDRELQQGGSLDMASAGPPSPGVLSLEGAIGGEMGLDLSIALQEEILKELERNSELIEQVLEKLAFAGGTRSAWNRFLARIGLL